MIKSQLLFKELIKTEFELFIDNRKELVIEENKLFSDIKMLNFNDGNSTLEKVRTLYGKMKES